MKKIIILILVLIASNDLQSQISIQGEIKEPILIGCHWKPKISQTCLYQSPTDKENYFFQFTNAQYPGINQITSVEFKASKEELELLFLAALEVYEKGNTLSLKIGEYDLMLIKEKGLSFHFSKKGELDSFFMLNKKQLQSLFGK